MSNSLFRHMIYVKGINMWLLHPEDFRNYFRFRLKSRRMCQWISSPDCQRHRAMRQWWRWWIDFPSMHTLCLWSILIRPNRTGQCHLRPCMVELLPFWLDFFPERLKFRLWQVIFLTGMSVCVKHHMNHAWTHMKSQADHHRTDREFAVGEWVFLKVWPHVQ